MSKKVVGYFNGSINLQEVKEKCSGYTDVIFAFWQSPTDGVTGAAASVINQPEIITFLKENNKKCILSAGGAYTPSLDDLDATEFGADLAEFAIKNNFDGIDFDIENLSVPPKESEIDWLVQATIAANDKAEKLNHKLQISHAPQAPYFTDNGGYSLVEKRTQGIIDFYNIQYYNQGTWGYQSYENYASIFETMYNGIPNATSIPSITNQGVPSEKLLVGKPITKQDLGAPDSTGYISMNQLSAIFTKAMEKEIDFGGVMGWKIDSDINGVWGKTMQACLANENVVAEV